MPVSTFLANKLLDHQFGKTSYTMPTCYVGLSSTTPAIAGTGVTEPSTGAYARVATTGSTWAAAASGANSNAAVITFPTATADWSAGANLTYGVVYDAATAGNLLWYGVLSVARPVLNGNIASIAIGGITGTLS